MLLLYKTTLAPALLWQGRRLRRTALRLPEPEGDRRGTVPGDAERGVARILVVGDSSAAGVGVAHQQQALAEPIAQALARRTGCEVHWQLAAQSGLDTVGARAYVRTLHLHRADVIICALGVNDVTAQRSARRFVGEYQVLLRELRQRTRARICVLSGVPPMQLLPAAPQPLRWYLGQCARRLDQALQDFCAREGRLRYLPLDWAKGAEMAPDGFHPGPAQYARWAEMNAEAVARALVLPSCPEMTATGPSATLSAG
ncbi:SGNH/GDSL hydrolase family protein [Aquincola tertiaricarbonis]|uniref:SGNH/GDSL hydrolase family protein n=1 Tax=Aquincola tertiaricarbonis TaxID=391953 RepID=A0ABY4SFJ3_AQUTE|nr:SGNH/GDSL hydrolase family protein [Aquincola tertiaricarbonis]URI10677.1 SGNH/GDSL hydrolase family protein [Aquincola tertiaricarbonis]